MCYFDMKKQIIIENIGVSMDGGTLVLKIKKEESIFYEVEFVQKVVFSSRVPMDRLPGSLVLNEKEVEIRSELEREILSEIRIAEFGMQLEESERDSFKRMILERIEFVESEDYITVAKKVGRIK
jgi:hypothetical protein